MTLMFDYFFKFGRKLYNRSVIIVLHSQQYRIHSQVDISGTVYVTSGRFFSFMFSFVSVYVVIFFKNILYTYSKLLKSFGLIFIINSLLNSKFLRAYMNTFGNFP